MTQKQHQQKSLAERIGEAVITCVLDNSLKKNGCSQAMLQSKIMSAIENTLFLNKFWNAGISIKK